MNSFRVAIIGCGRPGRGQARGHLLGYDRPDCEVVGLADIVEEKALGLRQELGLQQAAVFTDYEEMLALVRPDVVSVCLWPHLHGAAVLAAARAGVRAVHCEKPVAPTWGEALEMTRVCRQRGVQLTFNHQRRFGLPFVRARELLLQGTIGELLRVEGQCDNLFDWGTHWFDMFGYFNGDHPASWVLAQMEWRGSGAVFGVPIETMGLCQVGYSNDVQGLLITGKGRDMRQATLRLCGTHGTLEVGAPGEDGSYEGITLRFQNQETQGWQEEIVAEGLHEGACYPRAIADVLAGLTSGVEPQLSARRAMQGTELIFAAYESCRRRGKVTMPLEEPGSGLLTLLREHDALPAGALVG